MTETQEERVRRVLQDKIELRPYDPSWPARFAAEAAHLREILADLPLLDLQHVGSTAVPGLCAKPIVDILITVPDLEVFKARALTRFPSPTYDYFWSPSEGEDGPPFYAFFIKRDEQGLRSHHIHVVEPGFRIGECVVFRDYLRRHPEIAAEYAALKQNLAAQHAQQRLAYCDGKTAFIRRFTDLARAQAAAESEPS